MDIISWIALGFGLYFFIAAIFDWNWLLYDSRYELGGIIDRALGQTGRRKLWALIGVLCVGWAFARALQGQGL